ncbi:transporter substrate-binding domain-containing protein [Chitinivorax sp. B]|uniref:substrate-binding periplasmic protein n=1 Tax=Chitinivorax sp. B TaxID=2502235 RepID=UPI0010F95785|nr:transporter substrate-binding domain-containing protein [Chitinivorax sp. B]
MLARFLHVLLLLVGVLTINDGATAEEPKVYTVGVEDYENFLPYSQFKDGRYSGLGKDILDAFAQSENLIFDYQVYPLKRRDNLFVIGKLDLIFPDNPSWIPDLKRGRNVSYAPMLPFTDGVLVRREDLGKGPDNLRILGTPLGFTPYPYMQQIQWGQIAIEESPAYDSLYEKLAMGRVDGAYMNTAIARYYFSRNAKFQQGIIVYDPSLPHASGFWCLSSIKYPKLIERFKTFLNQNQALLDTMKRRYQFTSE